MIVRRSTSLTLMLATTATISVLAAPGCHDRSNAVLNPPCAHEHADPGVLDAIGAMITPMSDETDATLGAVLEAVRARLQQEREAALVGVVEVRAAVDAYVAAVEAHLAFEVLARNGLQGERPSVAPEQAARHLLEVVRQLPALVVAADTTATPRTSAVQAAAGSDVSTEQPAGSAARPAEHAPLVAVPEEPAPSSVTVHLGTAANVEPPPESGSGRHRVTVPLDDDGIALRDEFESIDFDTLKDADFLSYANDFAARARLRQEQGLGNTSDLEGRIIRKLTALAAGRHLPRPVFGLSRAHKGDWAAIAKRVRDEREGRASAPDRVSLTHRIPILGPADEDAGGDDERETEEPLWLPKLRAAAAASDVVMVGGIVKREKLDRVRARTGIEVEWIGLAAGKSPQAVASLAKRIREGRLAALVLLNGLMDHKQSEPLVAAAREVDLPVAYADKAGKGTLVKAFVDLEARIAGRAAE